MADIDIEIDDLDLDFVDDEYGDDPTSTANGDDGSGGYFDDDGNYIQGYYDDDGYWVEGYYDDDEVWNPISRTLVDEEGNVLQQDDGSQSLAPEMPSMGRLRAYSTAAPPALGLNAAPVNASFNELTPDEIFQLAARTTPRIASTISAMPVDLDTGSSGLSGKKTKSQIKAERKAIREKNKQEAKQRKLDAKRAKVEAKRAKIDQKKAKIGAKQQAKIDQKVAKQDAKFERKLGKQTLKDDKRVLARARKDWKEEMAQHVKNYKLAMKRIDTDEKRFQMSEKKKQNAFQLSLKSIVKQGDADTAAAHAAGFRPFDKAPLIQRLREIEEATIEPIRSAYSTRDPIQTERIKKMRSAMREIKKTRDAYLSKFRDPFLDNYSLMVNEDKVRPGTIDFSVLDPPLPPPKRLDFKRNPKWPKPERISAAIVPADARRKRKITATSSGRARPASTPTRSQPDSKTAKPKPSGGSAAKPKRGRAGRSGTKGKRGARRGRSKPSSQRPSKPPSKAPPRGPPVSSEPIANPRASVAPWNNAKTRLGASDQVTTDSEFLGNTAAKAARNVEKVRATPSRGTAGSGSRRPQLPPRQGGSRNSRDSSSRGRSRRSVSPPPRRSRRSPSPPRRRRRSPSPPRRRKRMTAVELVDSYDEAEADYRKYKKRDDIDRAIDAKAEMKSLMKLATRMLDDLDDEYREAKRDDRIEDAIDFRKEIKLLRTIFDDDY